MAEAMTEKPMTFEEALRTLEGAARYDARNGSSRSSRLTRQRRQEVMDNHAREVVEARNAALEEAAVIAEPCCAGDRHCGHRVMRPHAAIRALKEKPDAERG